MNRFILLNRSLFLFGAGCIWLLFVAGCNSVKIRAVKLHDELGLPVENARIEFKSRGSGHLLVDAVAGPTDKGGMATLSDVVHVNSYTYIVVKKDDWRQAVDRDGFSFEKPSTLVVKIGRKPSGLDN